MTNFVIDNTSLPFPKSDLSVLQSDPTKAISAADWNTVCQALLDLRGAVQGVAHNTAFAIWTDSLGMGPAVNTFEADPANNTALPNKNVVLVKKYSTGFVEPVTPIDMGTGPLRPENVNATPGYGPEPGIGAMLDELLNGPGATPDAAHKIWIAQLSLQSSKLDQWKQSSTAGTASPLLGGGNLDTDSSNQAATACAASGRTLAGAFVMLCTNDASDATATANIPTNIPAFIARKRAVHGNQLLFVWVVMQSTIPAGTFTQVATARPAQIAALQAATGTAIVYAEDIPTADDLTHFVAIGETVLSMRMCAAYIRLAGLAERVVTVPTVVGFSPATWNGSTHGMCGFTGVPGSNLRAWPWQLSADGDVMFMAVFMGRAPATGVAIPTPSGWAQAIQVASTDADTVENRVALFSKNLAQSELDTNVPSAGGPGFPISVTIAPGGTQFALKCFTVRGPTRFPAVGTPTSFAHTAFDGANVTAPGVTTTAANQTVFILITAWGNSNIANGFTVTNANLTGLAQVFGAAYPSSSGNYLYIALWTGTKATAAATGNSTLTPNSGTPACSSQGMTWAM
ncbi:MAG TPA: hypothetical protein VFZ00_11245 [Solirubrobacter sp.]|nr:hypothetical protein [Solirubrobacter sp.]